MANITIRIPDDRLQEICSAVGEVYHVFPDRNGLKTHFIQHLRETITEIRRRRAALGAEAPYGPEWGDLSNVTVDDE